MVAAASISLGEELVKKPPMAVLAQLDNDESLILTLVVEDMEAVAELKRREEGYARNQFAVSALRIGILALRQAQGSVDTEALRNEGQRLVSNLSHELEIRIADMDGKISASLKQYFDPQSGHFTERIERLVKKDGDLENVLRQQIGDGENSELARTLAKRVGENSPLMRSLDPKEAGGITQSISLCSRKRVRPTAWSHLLV
jgi:hypothetical protein